MAHHDLAIAWLNDAYAMERAIEPTRGHANLVKRCVERLGGDTSAIKTRLAPVVGGVPTIVSSPAEDELVKDAPQDYATEHFELATSKALVAAAQDVGDPETVRVCEEIIRDEEAVTRFLDQQLLTVVLEIVREKAAAHGRWPAR